MYCICSNLGGGIEIFLYLHPLTPKNCFWEGGGYKNYVTEMIPLLTFQSINNVLYFFLILGGGYSNIFYTPTPLQKKLFFKFLGSIEIFFIPPPPYTKKNCFWGV